jgi:hypothetical protein
MLQNIIGGVYIESSHNEKRPNHMVVCRLETRSAKIKHWCKETHHLWDSPKPSSPQKLWLDEVVPEIAKGLGFPLSINQPYVAHNNIL